MLVIAAGLFSHCTGFHSNLSFFLSARPPPPKPWERSDAAAASSSSPFAPSNGATATTTQVVAAAGTAGDQSQAADAETASGRQMPSRPWESSSGR